MSPINPLAGFNKSNNGHNWPRQVKMVLTSASGSQSSYSSSQKGYMTGELTQSLTDAIKTTQSLTKAAQMVAKPKTVAALNNGNTSQPQLYKAAGFNVGRHRPGDKALVIIGNSDRPGNLAAAMEGFAQLGYPPQDIVLLREPTHQDLQEKLNLLNQGKGTTTIHISAHGSAEAPPKGAGKKVESVFSSNASRWELTTGQLNLMLRNSLSQSDDTYRNVAVIANACQSSYVHQPYDVVKTNPFALSERYTDQSPHSVAPFRLGE
jgi:hypothetical protein